MSANHPSARPAANAVGLSHSNWWLRLGREVLVAILPGRAAGGGAAEFRLDGGIPFRPISQLSLPDGAGPGVLLLLRAAAEGALEIRMDGAEWQPLGPARPPHHLGELAAAAPRLLALVANKAAGPLRASADPGFLRALLGIAEPLAQPAPDGMRPLVGLAQGRQLWRVDAGGWLLTAAGLSRVPEPEAGLAPLAGAASGGILLRADAPPLRLAALAQPPSLVELARQGNAAPIGLLRQAFAALRRHTAEPWCRDSIRDAQVLAMAPPRAAAEPSNAVAGSIDRALSDHGGGVFCFGWLHDPLRLIRGLTLRGPFGPVPVPPEAIFRVTRPDIAKRFEQAPFGGPDARPGFVVHVPDAGPGPVAQWRLEVALGSGDAIELVAGPALIPAAQAREAVLRSVNPLEVGPDLLDRCITPAAERLHRAASAEPVGQEVIQIGDRPRDPPVSVVIPLYRNLRFVRHQVGAFARDPLLRDSEIIYVLDSPEQRGEAEHLLRGHCGLAGLAVTLVTHARNAGYATACNSGAAVATAPVLLQLNSDVVPDQPGWLQPMLAHLAADPRISCVGPKLMFDDGSLQHAGLYFARGPGNDWFNCHYFKGFPRHYPDANRARRVPGVTGAAMLMRRSAWDEVGGFHADYIVGDYEDSDLCLRLREAGGEILYEPKAELYHFERQSIAQHGGYAGTVAAAYNRRLHHRRWADRIEVLMRDFPQMGETFAAA
ncbi:glycosyltransferase [Falsiroseomonas sp. CW058]|uniref:glycosyltransferase n=1 Tax=Falsiroseomonas sp. CW058 TaxID=3388664 RepID=UPI003D31002A